MCEWRGGPGSIIYTRSAKYGLKQYDEAKLKTPRFVPRNRPSSTTSLTSYGSVFAVLVAVEFMYIWYTSVTSAVRTTVGTPGKMLYLSTAIFQFRSFVLCVGGLLTVLIEMCLYVCLSWRRIDAKHVIACSPPTPPPLPPLPAALVLPSFLFFAVSTMLDSANAAELSPVSPSTRDRMVSKYATLILQRCSVDRCYVTTIH